MHGTITLNGPLVWLYVAVVVGSWAMSAYVVLDAARRPATAFEVLRESRLFYIVPQALYFVFVLLGQIPKAPIIGWVVLFGMPLAIAQQVAYLLRVTFPTHKRLDARREAEARAAGEEPGEPVDAAGGEGTGGGDSAETPDVSPEAPDDPAEDPFRDEHY